MPEPGPLITIGITCHREGPWLAECWQSVLAQTDSRWTAVIVMDGGADHATRGVFEQLVHPNLRKVALSENVGPYGARNKAFEITETPYHLYLDGDDQLKPNAVASILRAFEAHPKADFAYGDVEFFGSYEGIWEPPRAPTAEDLIHDVKPPGASAYRKSLWERLGGFADELADGMADYDFFVGAHEIGAEGIHCGETIYRYRVGNPRKVSQRYLPNYHVRCGIIVQRHPAFFSDPERRRRFMLRAYRVSALAAFQRGMTRQARASALQAIVTDRAPVLRRFRDNWRYLVPRWSVPIAKRVYRRMRALGLAPAARGLTA